MVIRKRLIKHRPERDYEPPLESWRPVGTIEELTADLNSRGYHLNLFQLDDGRWQANAFRPRSNAFSVGISKDAAKAISKTYGLDMVD